VKLELHEHTTLSLDLRRLIMLLLGTRELKVDWHVRKFARMISHKATAIKSNRNIRYLHERCLSSLKSAYLRKNIRIGQVVKYETTQAGARAYAAVSLLARRLWH
jgi:hypothetical protein